MRVIYFTCGLPGTGKSSYCADIKRRLDPYGHGLFVTRDEVRAKLLNEYQNIDFSKFDKMITDYIVGLILQWRVSGRADTRTGICVIDGCHTDFSQVEYMVNCTGYWDLINILQFGTWDVPTWFDLDPERTNTSDFEAYKQEDGTFAATHKKIPKQVMEKKREEMRYTQEILKHYSAGFLRFYMEGLKEMSVRVTFVSVKETILSKAKNI